MDFIHLTDPVRQEVIDYAEQGQRHPDPQIAAAAQAWAESVFEHDRRPEKLLTVLARLQGPGMRNMAIGAMFNDPFDGVLRRRYTAYRILQAK